MLEEIQQFGGMTGTSEVAAAVGCARDTVYKKLKKLEGERRVRSRKGGGSLVEQVTGRRVRSAYQEYPLGCSICFDVDAKCFKITNVVCEHGLTNLISNGTD